MAVIISPAQLTETFTAAQIALIGINLGDIVEAPNHISRAYGLAKYRLVKLVDAVDAANKKLAVAATSGVWDVTMDVSGGTARANLWPIGMFIGTVDVSEAPYCFVQISGVAAYTAGSAAIIDGDPLMSDTSEDGDLTEATAGTDENIVGWSIGTVDDNAEGLVMLSGRMPQ